MSKQENIYKITNIRKILKNKVANVKDNYSSVLKVMKKGGKINYQSKLENESFYEINVVGERNIEGCSKSNAF